MDYKKWLLSEFAIAERRIEKSISDEMLKYANIENLSLLLADHVNIGLRTYKNEVIRIVEELNKLEFLKAKDFKKMQDILINNTERAFIHTRKYCNVKTDYDESKETFKHILDNIDCIIESCIEKQIYIKRKNELSTLFDIVKMIVSAVLGGLIAYIIK